MNEILLNELKTRFAKELALESSGAYSMGLMNQPRPLTLEECEEIVDRIVNEVQQNFVDTTNCPSCGGHIPLTGAHSCPGCGYSI